MQDDLIDESFKETVSLLEQEVLLDEISLEEFEQEGLEEVEEVEEVMEEGKTSLVPAAEIEDQRDEDFYMIQW